mmetsp:Transcript_28528/g.92523  ORF Transcript_28528/g.92523 Transcript_28528/m.92523 type:complete len:225 (+) Transcript_28528:208-882(+)
MCHPRGHCQRQSHCRLTGPAARPHGGVGGCSFATQSAAPSKEARQPTRAHVPQTGGARRRRRRWLWQRHDAPPLAAAASARLHRHLYRRSQFPLPIHSTPQCRGREQCHPPPHRCRPRRLWLLARARAHAVPPAPAVASSPRPGPLQWQTYPLEQQRSPHSSAALHQTWPSRLLGCPLPASAPPQTQPSKPSCGSLPSRVDAEPVSAGWPAHWRSRQSHRPAIP